MCSNKGMRGSPNLSNISYRWKKWEPWPCICHLIKNALRDENGEKEKFYSWCIKPSLLMEITEAGTFSNQHKNVLQLSQPG